jgi:two-component system sensor histidine kinase/response regulator
MVMQNSPIFSKEITFLPACSLPACQIAWANENFFLINANSAFHAQFSRKNREASLPILPKLLHEACITSRTFVTLCKQLKLKGELENYDLRCEEGIKVKNFRINAFQHQNTAEHTIWTIYLQDVSDLIAEIENANAASKMKSLFLATMSHEIRTPMQPLYGLLEIMQQEATDTRQADTINAAKGAASALLQILDDVLDLAKIEAGRMDLDYFEVPLRTLIDGIMTTLSQKAKEKGIHLSCEFASDLPRVVMGDPKRLRQVIMNLVVNALKFTERGSVVIRLKCQDFKEDGQHFTLCCEVEDSGIGVSPELLPHLFEPFTQGDFSTTRRYRGTGLGLSITHRLLQLMNGAIGVSSMEGQGSLFWFNIPTSAVAHDAVQVGAQPDLRGVHILLLEDHPQGAKTIMMTLHSMGATVIGVETIEDALERSEIERFDVAIVD